MAEREKEQGGAGEPAEAAAPAAAPRGDARGTGAAARAGDAREADDGEKRRRLHPEDQARVDGFLRRGVNSVDRKPFRPLLLMIMLIAVVTGLSLLSQWLAHRAGVY